MLCDPDCLACCSISEGITSRPPVVLSRFFVDTAVAPRMLSDGGGQLLTTILQLPELRPLRDGPVLTESTAKVAADGGDGVGEPSREEVKPRLLLDRIPLCRNNPIPDGGKESPPSIDSDSAGTSTIRSDLAVVRTQGASDALIRQPFVVQRRLKANSGHMNHSRVSAGMEQGRCQSGRMSETQVYLAAWRTKLMRTSLVMGITCYNSETAHVVKRYKLIDPIGPRLTFSFISLWNCDCSPS